MNDDRYRQILFRLLAWLIFIDRREMNALYRDAYRRIMVPWISRNVLGPAEILSEDYEIQLRELLRKHLLLSVTESFDFPAFRHVNDLAGLVKPKTLEENPQKIPLVLPRQFNGVRGIIILEDFVGSGTQVGRVLTRLIRQVPRNLPILFVPLIILEHGVNALSKKFEQDRISLKPVYIIRKSTCVGATPVVGEPQEFKDFRSLIEVTSHHVLQSLGPLDDPPENAFGYKGCGALLATCHNVPNNTLPLIHHRAPNWSPLFRRVHSSKDGL